MIKKFIIPFFFSFTLLILSEYFLLEEVYSAQRLLILLLCSTGILISILCFRYFYKKFQKITK